MAPSTLHVHCPSWAIPGSSNLPQPDPGQETSCARLGGWGEHGSMTAAISWRPQAGTTRIPAWLHRPPDSLSQALALKGHPIPWCQRCHRTQPGSEPGSLQHWHRQEFGAEHTFWSGLGRMVVSAGFNRQRRQPQPPSSRLPAHPAASPSPTRTKFPTCLSVSDSSRKYLAARAPAVLSPLCLLPCLPRGALQTQPGTGGGRSQKAWWAAGEAKAGGTSLNSKAPPPAPRRGVLRDPGGHWEPALAGRQLLMPPLPPGTSQEDLPEASHSPRPMKQHLPPPRLQFRTGRRAPRGPWGRL